MEILTDEQIENLSLFEVDTYCHYAIDSTLVNAYSSNIKQAFELIEYAKSNGFWCQIKTPFTPNDPYICGFTPHGVTGWNGRPDHCGAAPTLETAICKAFLRWHRDYKEGNLTDRKYYEERHYKGIK